MFDKKLSRDHSKNVTDERFNALSHIVAAMAAVFGGSLLAVRTIQSRNWIMLAANLIYAACLINLFIMSSLHHSVNGSKRTMGILRKLDYAAVFGLIAGTVTPLTLTRDLNPLALTVLAATWLLAIAGITLNSSVGLPKHIINAMYLTLGWLPAISLVVVPGRFDAAQTLLLAIGGAFYSVGFIIYAVEKPNPRPGKFGFHEIWHSLVVIGALMHYLLIYSFLG